MDCGTSASRRISAYGLSETRWDCELVLQIKHMNCKRSLACAHRLKSASVCRSIQSTPTMNYCRSLFRVLPSFSMVECTLLFYKAHAAPILYVTSASHTSSRRPFNTLYLHFQKCLFYLSSARFAPLLLLLEDLSVVVVEGDDNQVVF